MNTLKSVFSKIAEDKTELAKHEVNLAGVKDLERKIKQVLDTQKKLDKINPSLEKLIQQQKNEKGMLDVYVRESETILSEFDKQAKELGVSPDSVSQYKALKNEISISKSEYLK